MPPYLCRYLHQGVPAVAMLAVTSEGRQSAAVAQGGAKKAKPQGKFDLKPPKGTRDFYPEDMRLQSWLFGHFRRVAAEFGFEEYDAPVVENEDLYIRKAGEEVIPIPSFPQPNQQNKSVSVARNLFVPHSATIHGLQPLNLDQPISRTPNPQPPHAPSSCVIIRPHPTDSSLVHPSVYYTHALDTPKRRVPSCTHHHAPSPFNRFGTRNQTLPWRTSHPSVLRLDDG